MINLRQAAQQALEALELGCTDGNGNPVDLVGPAVTALKAALAEPVQEPVMYQWEQRESGRASVVGPFWGPVYLSSPQRPAEPVQEPSVAQSLRDAGFASRDTRLTCDECGGKYTRQMLPIHKCIAEPAPEPVQEPVAWGVFEGENLHDFFTSREDAEKMAGYKGSHATVMPIYTAPPQRKPLTEEEIDSIPCTDGDGSDWDALVRFARAIERAHGIGGEK